MAKRHHSEKRYSDSGHVRGTTGYYKETEGMGRFDADMINEDKGAHANLPTEVKMVAYPNSFGHLPDEYLDDTIRGIDEQKMMDHQGMMKQLKPRKGF